MPPLFTTPELDLEDQQVVTDAHLIRTAPWTSRRSSGSRDAWPFATEPSSLAVSWPSLVVRKWAEDPRGRPGPRFRAFRVRSARSDARSRLRRVDLDRSIRHLPRRSPHQPRCRRSTAAPHGPDNHGSPGDFHAGGVEYGTRRPHRCLAGPQSRYAPRATPAGRRRPPDGTATRRGTSGALAPAGVGRPVHDDHDMQRRQAGDEHRRSATAGRAVLTPVEPQSVRTWQGLDCVAKHIGLCLVERHRCKDVDARISAYRLVDVGDPAHRGAPTVHSGAPDTRACASGFIERLLPEGSPNLFRRGDTTGGPRISGGGLVPSPPARGTSP